MEKKKQEEVGKAIDELGGTEVIKEASPKDKALSAQQIKMIQKRQAMELAEYKRRLKDSVELKRLQVEEVELNLRYFEAKKAWKIANEEIMKLEAEEQAEEQRLEELRKKEMEEKLPAKPKIIGVEKGKPRTEEEIAEGKK